MTYAYDWSDDYATGISLIDAQHKRLFQYLRDVDHAMKARDDEGTGLIVRSLLEYAVSHCAFEESLMKQAQYPFYEQHKHSHDLFRERAAVYVQRMDSGIDRYHLAREVRSEIALWLSGHIAHDDQDYVPFVLAMHKPEGIMHRMLDKLKLFG